MLSLSQLRPKAPQYAKEENKNHFCKLMQFFTRSLSGKLDHVVEKSKPYMYVRELKR